MIALEKLNGKEERMELRLSSLDKNIFKRAQLISGDKSLSSFIVRVLKREAQKIVAENDAILLTERDREVFFNAIIGEFEPTEALVAAASAYSPEFSEK